MTTVVQDQIALLYQAMATKYGISVLSSNVALTRARCYKARAQAQDPDLACLQFRPDPHRPDKALWIVKGEAPDGKD